MRRKDRELTAQEGLAIIDACEYGTISCVDEAGEIFSVPISVAREGGSVFLHGAPAGSKAKLLNDGRNVTLVCVSYARVPVLTDEQLDAIKDDGKALGAKVFTTEGDEYLRAKNRKPNRKSKDYSRLTRAKSAKFQP